MVRASLVLLAAYESLAVSKHAILHQPLPLIMIDSPKPKRRWYQFSLRTLLLVMLLFSVTVGWMGSRMHRARVNRDRVASVEEAVAAIEEAGGKVTAEYAGLRPPALLEELFDDPGSADDPVGILMVTVVKFSGSTVTDADLEHVKGVTALKELWIGGDWIAKRAGVFLFVEVHDRSTITDAGMSHLKGLTNLRTLDLSHASVTDAGLKHLKGLTSLQELYLSGTRVTDAGLEHLKGLTKLELLYLKDTQVTDEGVKKLQQALPNCKIHR